MTGQLNRNTVIATGVVLLHVAALWALQSGLVRRVVEVVLPVELISEIITPPAPKVEPPPPAPRPPEPVMPQSVQRKVERALPPAPQPVAIADSQPAPNAPLGVVAPQSPAPPIAAPVASEPAPAPSPPAPPAPPPKVEPPLIDADYSPNLEAFRAPAISRRLGEYGKVLLSVTVGVGGNAVRVQVLKSSGYARLDNAAVEGARKLRYKPATRAGQPVEWTYELPVTYSENP